MDTRDWDQELIEEQESLEADLEVERQKNTGYGTRNDQLAAVIDKVRAKVAEWQSLEGEGPRTLMRNLDGGIIESILATAPAEALREHDAKVRAEALRDAQSLIAVDGYFCPALDDRIEREAGLK